MSLTGQGEPEGALVDGIAASIRARIMSGEFAIGSPLRQAALAAEFGVSRTPIREALRQLQDSGLIEVAPNKGATIRVPLPWEVREAYEVRAELEGMAARRATGRITRAQLAEMRAQNESLRAALTGEGGAVTTPANDIFHTTVCVAADNALLTSMVARINESFPRSFSAQALAGDERHREANVREHDEIIAALEAGDPERARAAMQAHIVTSGEYLATWYERRSRTVYQP